MTKAHQIDNEGGNLREEILDLLAEILAVERTELTDETDLVDDLGIESIELVSIVATVESRLGLTVDIRQLMSVRKLGQMLTIVSRSQPSGSR